MRTGPARPQDRGIVERLSRLSRTTIVVAGAALVASVTIAASVIASRPSRPAPAAQLLNLAATDALLAGIAQKGVVLGRPDAPVRLVEFADLQCPYCGELARVTLPTLIARYVRSGKLSLEFRGLSFVGADSERLLRLAQAASARSRLWQVVELSYQNQGAENTGWATDDMLDSLARAASSHSRDLLAAQQASWVTANITRDARMAESVGVTGTPYVLLGRRGEPLRHLALAPTDLAGFEAAIEGALRE
jgi:protein-disulfide isomerase